MVRRAKGKRPNGKREAPTLAQWTAEYPEARVTRRELYTILSQIIEAPPAPEEPKEIEA